MPDPSGSIPGIAGGGGDITTDAEEAFWKWLSLVISVNAFSAFYSVAGINLYKIATNPLGVATDPKDTRATYAFLTASGALAAVGAWGFVDPADASFQVPVEFHSFEVPLSLPEGGSVAELGAIAATQAMEGYVSALLHAMERRRGAQLANDEWWVALHTASARYAVQGALDLFPIVFPSRSMTLPPDDGIARIVQTLDGTMPNWRIILYVLRGALENEGRSS